MKRLVKDFVAVIVAAIVVSLVVKQESFLEAHYDTSERRNIERISLLGIEISQSIDWTKDGYRSQYRTIFGREPSNDRWHSLSKRPIRSSQFFHEYQWSVMTSHSISLRDSLVRGIFERYQRDLSATRARESFAELEALLPSTERLESLDHEEVRSIRNKAKDIRVLRDLMN